MDDSHQEYISCKPWTAPHDPARMLVLRFHAIGDVAITLPSCSGLRNRFPSSRIDFLTDEISAGLPSSLDLFDNIYTIRATKNRWDRLEKLVRIGIDLRRENYDVVFDLQRNRVSRLIRLHVAPKAWTEFDRFSPVPAGVRVQQTIERTGFKDFVPCYSMNLKKDLGTQAETMLMENGWDGQQSLVVLNPAGLFESRNWPLENYVNLADLIAHDNGKVLLLGTTRLLSKAAHIQKRLGSLVINLVGKTTLNEVFALLQFARGVISEDSGLMHMAWVSAIPTLAMLGSTRHDWAMPLGTWSRCLHSGDLECGDCNQQFCRFGDVHCLTRYTPDFVFQEFRNLLADCPPRAIPS